MIKKDERLYVVESEKTALICDLFFDDGVFLATGGLTNVLTEKLQKIGGDIVLIPDSDGIWRWRFLGYPIFDIRGFAKASNLEHLFRGFDLADVIVEFMLNKLRG